MEPNADVIPSSLDTAVSTSSYGFLNTTHKLAARLFGIPSRVLARMRRLDEIFDPQIQHQNYATVTGLPNGLATSAPEPSDVRIHSRMRSGLNGGQAGVAIPGPWGFLTSGYFIGVFIMAFLLNRIQNIVVPPRQSVMYHNNRHLRGFDGTRRTSYASFIMGFLFPVDLASSFSRLAFRVPSIYLLGKTITLWMVVLLQSSDAYPTSEWSWVQRLGQWVGGKNMEEICWFTFTSVCVTLFVGALTSGLEGLGSTNQTPFNLFAYSFVLYLYTSPAMHVKKPLDNGNSRPDKQVVVTMMLPLAQLMLTHCMEIKQRWARNRLVPTTIIGIISLVHFHAVLWFFPSSYPLPNYIPNIVETILFTVTITTCALNALTQLLLTGSVTKPLFGHTASLMPKWEEDFTVVMFRLGTASLEATSVAGLGNEVSGVAAASGNFSLSRRAADDQATVELHRSGTVSYSGPVRGLKAKRGFANEITRIKARSATAQQETWVDSIVDPAGRRELTRFGKALWRVLKGTWALIRRGRSSLVSAGEEQTPGEHSQHGVSDSHEDDLAEGDYARFLRGETLSDDEEDDAEFCPRSRSSSPAVVSDAESDIGEEDDRESDEAQVADGEAVSLYADLSLSASDSTSAPLLLAHMTSMSSSPLTRRRYNRLLSSGSRVVRSGADLTDAGEWEEYVLERREAKAWKHNDQEDLTRRNCVVCTVEPREIICWPCRCLALCDDCRENMASRSAASKHTCPCCRRSVEGYSKIYIP